MNSPESRLFGPLVRYLARPGPLPLPARKAALSLVCWLWGVFLSARGKSSHF